MKDAAESWEKGDTYAKPVVAHNAQGYVNLLRQHILKENNILFPMAERVIPIQEQNQVDINFEQVREKENSAGIQVKFGALAETLEKESTANIR